MSVVFESGSGTITVPDSALLQIAVRAAESVEGVRVRRKRTVDVEGKLVRLEVTVQGNEPLGRLPGRPFRSRSVVRSRRCAGST